jgi:hypothetical protein
MTMKQHKNDNEATKMTMKMAMKMAIKKTPPRTNILGGEFVIS